MLSRISGSAKLHRGMAGLQRKHSHDWHCVIRPMEMQQASGNKQKKIINKRAGEQACHSNGYVVPTNTNVELSETHVGMRLSPALIFLFLFASRQKE